MADDINKKISIDVEINTDGQQQINQYKNSFDNLRNSLSNLADPINELSGNIKSLDQDLSKVSSTGDKFSSKIGEVSSSFSIFSKVIEETSVATGGWGLALSAALSVITAFAPQIIKWISNLTKGSGSLSAFNKVLQDSKAIMDGMNQVLAKGRQDSQQEIVNINILRAAAEDNKLAMDRRLKAVKDLREQYPGYFGKMSAEIILTGKATNTYDLLTQAIKKSNQAKASKDQLVQNGKDQDNIKGQIDAETANYNKLIALKQATENELQKFKSLATGPGNPNSDDLSLAGNQEQAIYAKLSNLDQKIRSSSDALQALKSKNQLIATSSKYLSDFIENINRNSGKQVAMLNNVVNVDKHLQKTINSINNKAKKLDSSPGTRDSTVLGPALSAGVPQNDEQPGFVNATIAADDNIAAKPDQAAIDKFNKAKEAAQQLKDFEIQTAQQTATAAFGILQNSIKQQAEAKIAALESQKNAELSNTNLTSSQKAIIEAKYKKQEDKVKAKAFKEEQEASLAQAVINGALAITKATSQTGILSPFVVPGIIAETAIQVATIIAQKPPAYATGGLHYNSDGKGGLLPGYSRTDNTNAYLRSGEGIVVSEAMRNPWARNLVSAINVGFGGRDFSTTVSGSGFAVGGIFTDGGDANRYYNAPVNDQKNLANSIAYQMINNFPPVYVDVKDINNQQNILAQTINRVNL